MVKIAKCIRSKEAFQKSHKNRYFYLYEKIVNYGQVKTGMKRETINLNLKRFTDMGKNLYQVILGELSLYSQCQKKEIYDEFRRKYPGRFCTTNLIVFLKEKLEIEEYWGNENWLKLWMGHYSLSDSRSRLDFPEISRDHLR